jgi:hypothetical protein
MQRANGHSGEPREVSDCKRHVITFEDTLQAHVA